MTLYFGNIHPYDIEQSTEVEKIFEKLTELIALCERDDFIDGFLIARLQVLLPAFPFGAGNICLRDRNVSARLLRRAGSANSVELSP